MSKGAFAAPQAAPPLIVPLFLLLHQIQEMPRRRFGLIILSRGTLYLCE